MAKKRWRKIKDANVRHIWKCPECNKETDIEPTFYADAGTPMCECDLDMVYVRTEILK